METDVVVYGSACPACTQAKAVLDRYRIAYRSRPITELPRQHGTVRSMPQITIDDELLGGIDQLLRLTRLGGLERIAADAPEPWVRIRRRLGRGYDVEVLDRLGRTRARERAASRVDAEELSARLTST